MPSKYITLITAVFLFYSPLSTLLISTHVKAASIQDSHSQHGQSHQPSQPIQHSLMGSHGMVLIYNEKEGLFASHLPLYSSPHNYQIIYKVNTDNNKPLIQLLQKGMVTLLPDNFDLSKLIKGENFLIKTSFFEGHFERGGKQQFTTNMTFEKPILIEKVSTTFSSNNATFYNVPISENTAIIAHKIQRSPSFDAIGFLDRTRNQSAASNNKFDKTNNKPLMNTELQTCNMPSILKSPQIKKQLENCNQFDFKYIETKDFR